MNKLVLSAAIVLCGCALTFAQNEKKPEFFGGYSFETVDSGITSTDLNTSTTLDNRFKTNGFNLAGTGYLTKRFGITADFSGSYKTRNDTFGTATGQSKLSLYNFTAGPQIRFSSHGKVTPFVQGLAGFARRNLSETFAATTTTFSDNKTSFALNLGGGLDYKLSNRFAWRIFQVDYNPIFLRARTVNTTAIPNRTLNGFRFSTGIVIK